MSLSRYQLERADLTVILEQGRRVEGDLYAENHRTMQTMGELLKARVFGATEYALSLRKRMTKFQGTDKAGQAHPRDGMHPVVMSQSASPEFVQGASTTPSAVAENAWVRGHAPPEPHPDLDAEEDWRPSHLNFVVEPLIGRLKVPARYRKDESDK